jgi:hypothetical protein
MSRMLPTLILSLVLCGITSVNAQQHSSMSDQEVMESVKGAAPPSVVDNATVMNIGSDGQMKMIREGSNGWTCMDPGGAPMCADKAGLEWGQAYMEKGPAPQKLGFIYMLKGDTGTGISNTDPYAAEATPDNNWVKTGPHVMIVGAEAKSMTQSYPRQAKPDPTKPYVMWAGTPYEHLMLPVQ